MKSFTHTQLSNILGDRIKMVNSFTQVMKKKMSTNVITHWLEQWISQRHQMEINDNKILDVFLVSGDQKEHLKRS